MIRSYLRTATLLGVDRFVAERTENPLADTAGALDLGAWLARASDALERHDPLYPVIVWPPQPDRGRIYIHLLEETGIAIGFAKVSLDERNDATIANEARMLRALAVENHSTFRITRILAEFECADRTTVIIKPLPVRARNVPSEIASYPTEAVASFAGSNQTMTLNELEALLWWSRLAAAESGDLPAMVAEIQEYMERVGGLDMCRVHGDLGPGNLLRTPEGELWIIDWEGAGVGPRLTDQVNYHLALNQSRILSDPGAGLREFLEHWLGDPRTHEKMELAAALLYLASVGIRAAELLLQEWDEPLSRPHDHSGPT